MYIGRCDITLCISDNGYLTSQYLSKLQSDKGNHTLYETIMFKLE